MRAPRRHSTPGAPCRSRLAGLWLLVLTATVGTAAAADVPVYGVFELTLTATGSYADPYAQMPGDNTSPGFVVGTFTGPSAQTITIDGFWDGGSTWKLRMAPTEAGTWTYSTSSADPGLDGQKGSFTAVASGSRGFIGTDPGRPHLFVWSDGSPFPMRPTSMNVHAAKKGGGLYGYGGWFDDGTFQQMVDARAAQGFTAMNWGMILTKWGIRNGTQENEGGQPFANMDLANPLNPAYFQAADDRVVYALSRGLIPQFGVVWPDTLPSGWTTERGKRLWRYVIARYAAYNVTWNLFGEGMEWGSDAVLEDWGDLTERHDPYGHPTSVHTTNRTGVQGASWVDYIIIQDYDRPDLSVADAWGFDKPVIQAEYGGYDQCDDPVYCTATEDERRILAWKIRMRGGFPVYESWGTDLDTPDSRMYAYLHSFFDTVPWTRLEPRQDLVDRGLCLASPGESYLVHLENGGSVALDLSASTARYQVSWHSPGDGSQIDQPAVDGGNTITFIAPDNGDWVLRLSADLAAPSAPGNPQAQVIPPG